MKIAIIGAGFVGLTLAACHDEHEIVLIERDNAKRNKLRRGYPPFRETGLDERLSVSVALGRISVIGTGTRAEEEALAQADVTVIAVGTPASKSGRPDPSALLDAVGAWVGSVARDDSWLVIRSTITPSLLARVVDAAPAPLRPRIVYSPEFLAEGSAVQDTLSPSRVVVGFDGGKSPPGALEAVLAALTPGEIPADVVVTDRTTASLIKYGANAMLAARLSALNQLAMLCEAAGGDLDGLLAGVGSDPRIGRDYLAPGAGWGGSCFPKDVLALRREMEDSELTPGMWTQTLAMNRIAVSWPVMTWLKETEAGAGAVAILGVAFKPGTDDVRESPALKTIEVLVHRGRECAVYVHDEEAATQHLAVEGFEVIDDVFTGEALAQELADLGVRTVIIQCAHPGYRGAVLALLDMKDREPVLVIDCRGVMENSDLERAWPGDVVARFGRPVHRA